MCYFNERFYTDDFDQEMMNFVVTKYSRAKQDWCWDKNQNFLVYGFSNNYFWTEDSNINSDKDYKYLTKQQFKEKIGMTTKTFTKADLKDGMRLINRDGNTYYLLGRNLLTYNPDAYLGNGAFNQATYITCYSDQLLNPHFKSLDIMKVIDRDDKVLFVREEKSETQIQFEKLQQQIEELQAQASKLKATF